MFFHLFSEHINLFRYLTFRGIAAAVTSLLLILFCTPFFIEKLRVMKFGQQVRDDGPQAHLVKNGTPTMGGLFIWGAVLVSVFLWAEWNIFVLIVSLSVVLFSAIGFVDDYAKIKQKNTKGLSPFAKLFLQMGFALFLLILTWYIPAYHQQAPDLKIYVGHQNNVVATNSVSLLQKEWVWEPALDDSHVSHYVMTEYSNPETGKPEITRIFNIPALVSNNLEMHRFTYQLISNTSHKVWAKITRSDIDKNRNILRTEEYEFHSIYKARLFTAQFLPYYTEVLWYWPLWLILPFFIFIIIGVSNATNLADGLDGLASGMGIAFYVPFGVLAYLMGNKILSGYLFYPYIPGIGELAIFIAAVIGAFTGFLWYNVHPAHIFMGDTGSLPMGSTIALIAVMLRQELLLVIAGFMFVLETLSVIIQVFSFKKFKRRVFRMAPIHHHFELSGWSENQVVGRFWILSAICAVLALVSIKIR